VTRPILSLTAAELGEACVLLALLRDGGWPEAKMRIRYGASDMGGFSASVDIEGKRAVLFRAVLTAGGKVNGYAAMAFNTGDHRLALPDMPVPLRRRDISYDDFLREATAYENAQGWQPPN
jgi:hypothetical protein